MTRAAESMDDPLSAATDPAGALAAQVRAAYGARITGE